MSHLNVGGHLRRTLRAGTTEGFETEVNFLSLSVGGDSGAVNRWFFQCPAQVAAMGYRQRFSVRWGVMGPSLQWHLGGGPGGIRHFIEHLMDPLAGLMDAGVMRNCPYACA